MHCVDALDFYYRNIISFSLGIWHIKVYLMKSHIIRASYIYVKIYTTVNRLQESTCLCLKDVLFESSTEQFPDLWQADDVVAHVRGALVLKLKEGQKDKSIPLSTNYSAKICLFTCIFDLILKNKGNIELKTNTGTIEKDVKWYWCDLGQIPFPIMMMINQASLLFRDNKLFWKWTNYMRCIFEEHHENKWINDGLINDAKW